MKNIVDFLRILQFCATIKHTFNKNKVTLLSYYKYYILPNAREILNSAGISYKFGNFAIKIDKEINLEGKENSLKIEDWLVEEKEIEKKKINKKEKIRFTSKLISIEEGNEEI